MPVASQFDIEVFRRLIQDGKSRKDAALACGVQPGGLSNILRRRGWKLVKQESLALVAIPGTPPRRPVGRPAKVRVTDCNDGLGTGDGAAPLHGSEGQ